MQWVMQERVDLACSQGLHRWSEQLMMPGDANAHRWAVTVYRDGVPLDLTGWDVHAYLTRADNVCVPLQGMADGCAAGVSFVPACYAVRGELRGTLQACKDDVRITLAHGIWQVGKPHSDQVVDSGDVIPSLPELLAQISTMEAVTADARAAIKELGAAMTAVADPIVCDTSGAVAEINDAAARPLVRLSSVIAAVQAGSGDPSPDNVRPISGWDTVSVKHVGKNLVDIPDFVDTSGKDIYTATVDRFAAVKYKESTQYTVSMKISTEDTTNQFGIRVFYSDGSSEYKWNKIGSTYVPSVSTAAGKTVSQIVLTYNSIFVLSLSDVQLEEGAIATAYEPYQAESLTAELPETVYGGSLDWTTGVLTVTHVGKAVRAADISYKYGSSMSGWQTSTFVTKPDLSLAAGRLTSLCSHFKNTMDTAYTAGSARHGIFSDHPTMTTKYFAWGEPDATVTDFQNWLEEQYAAGTPVVLFTLLKEPYTIQLAPQQLDMLKANNMLWSDCGDTSVAYVADTKMYIDKVVGVLYEMFFNAMA